MLLDERITHTHTMSKFSCDRFNLRIGTVTTKSWDMLQHKHHVVTNVASGCNRRIWFLSEEKKWINNYLCGFEPFGFANYNDSKLRSCEIC